MDAQLLVDAQATLGECPLWCERSGALYWTDIEGRTLTRWREAADGPEPRLRHWTLPERVACFALCESPGQLLLGLASGIALFNLESQALSPTIPVEPDMPQTRLNDGRCDAQGRFVFGMYNQVHGGAPIGYFYRVDAQLQIERLPLPPAKTANSIAFSPDGTRLYFADTPSRRIQCCDYRADGRIGAARLFATVAPDDGRPDGACVDAEGGLWNARYAGHCVARHDPDTGVVTERMTVPTGQVTCPAFGGAQLDRLFITTARQGLDEAALQREPAAGGVFAARPARRGLPERRFAGARRI